MLLSTPDVDIYIYRLDNTTIQLIGELNDASSLQYAKRFVGYGLMELYVPFTKLNTQLCKVGNMVSIGSSGRYCYIITGIEPQKDENGFIKIKVTGRGLEHLLYMRMLYTTHKYTDVPLSDIMYNLVQTNFITPATGYERRILPHLVLEDDAYEQDIGPVLTIQRTGKSVKDRLDELCTDYNVGYEIYYSRSKNKLVFRVQEHRDMTYDGTAELPVIFDTETDDVLESDYVYNVEAERNMALVVGEAQESTEQDVRIRAKVVVGDDTLTGYNRKELYIDARDLQSDYESETGSLDEMTDEEYEELLRNRGAKKLAENAIVQSFEASIRYYGSQYQYDEDYMVGDKVTIVDRDMNIIVDAYISEVEQIYTDVYELRLTIGTSVPTLYSKIKAMLQD